MSIIESETYPSTLSDSEISILKKHGIQAREVIYFSVEAFQYTNIDDAVAAAKRRDKAANET